MNSPSKTLKNLYTKATTRVKLSFSSALIISLLTHIYGIIHLIPNHDSIQSTLFHNQDMLFQGRWFQKYASLITSPYCMPWVNGCISILLLSISAVLIVSLFDIKNNINIVLVSGLMVTFPTISCCFAYLYMADAFMIALLFSVLAVYVSRSLPKWGFLISSILVCLSLGIYQSYICFTLSLYVILALFNIMTTKKSNKQVIIQGIKDIVSLIIGVILYILILNILLDIHNTTLTNYQNINQLNNYSIFNFLPRIKATLEGFIHYFKITTSLFYNKSIAILHILILLISAVYSLYIFLRNKLWKNIFTTAIFILLVILTPISLYSIALISAGSIHTLMIYSMSLIFVIFIKLSEEFCDNNKINSLKNISLWFTFIATSIIICANYLLANSSYLSLQVKYNQTYAYATKLSTRIESSEDYYDGVPVVFIGYTNIYHYLESPLIGFSFGDRYIIFKPARYYNFLHDYIGANYTRVSEETMNKIQSTDRFKQMPIYPAKDSIDIIDDVLVVKLS